MAEQCFETDKQCLSGRLACKPRCGDAVNWQSGKPSLTENGLSSIKLGFSRREQRYLMMQNVHRACGRRSPLGFWWMRLCGLLLFVYAVNYAPVHLALEIHEGHFPGAKPPVESRAAPLFTAEQPAGSDHAPHLASDHSLRMVVQAKVTPVVCDCCLTTATVEVCRSQFVFPLFLTERQNPPGLPPPDPLQPRAPPLA